MTISKKNNYSQTDTNIEETQLTLDACYIGKHDVTLTNYNTTTLPAVAAGSVIEVGGSLFEVTAEEAITGSPSDGTVYIMMVPSDSTLVPTFTNTAPTWLDSLQGWYNAAGTSRYLEFVMVKSDTSYSNKRKLTDGDFPVGKLNVAPYYTFLTSGSFVPPYGTTWVFFILVGGSGGGGGGISASYHDGTLRSGEAGEPGKAGKIVRGQLPISVFGGDYSITFGSGGVAGTGGSEPTDGGDGGDTYFNGIDIKAIGGKGGAAGNIRDEYNSGISAALSGEDSAVAYGSFFPTGSGGGAGEDGTGYGGGGGGGNGGNNSLGGGGGNGGAGTVGYAILQFF